MDGIPLSDTQTSQTPPGPAIVFHAQFVAAPDVLFAHLLKSVVWDERMQARKTASYGVAYDYSQMCYPATAMPADLAALCQQLQIALGFLPNNCLLNYYPDGNASMGFHSDSSEQLAPGSGVAIVSLGSERRIVFRHKLDKTLQFDYLLPVGSLFYMPDAIQSHWLHAIPKETAAGARISLTFRAVEKALELEAR